MTDRQTDRDGGRGRETDIQTERARDRERQRRTVGPLNEDAEEDEGVERDPEDLQAVVLHVAQEGVPAVGVGGGGVGGCGRPHRHARLSVPVGHVTFGAALTAITSKMEVRQQLMGSTGYWEVLSSKFVTLVFNARSSVARTGMQK